MPIIFDRREADARRENREMLRLKKLATAFYEGDPLVDIEGFGLAINDQVAGLLVAGTNISLTYNSGAGELTIDGPALASDPWTYAKLASDFTNDTITPTATGLEIGPFDANETYVFEGMFILQSAATTTGAQVGFNAPTGTTAFACRTSSSSSATAITYRNSTGTASQQAQPTAAPSASADFFGDIYGTMVFGGSPSGNLQITLDSEIAGSLVTMKAGSWLRYRKVP